MRSTLHCFGVGVVLFSLVPSILPFSRGANHASCQEMIPGHISAQPQYLQHSHITLRTSASSYLPGQLLTVTVRTSRDFMGFLLQARSVDVGGSWTFTAPGTHTLRCFSDGDTLTHSDKQLKRNLSFVWRAPDAPMGDIQFYITVVQSYFVYWAGIKSAVSTLHSSSSTSDHTLLASSLVHHSSTTPPYPSTGSPLVSMHPSIKSKLFTHSSSSSVKDQPKTAPAISALTSPSPISVPPNFPSDQPSSTSPVPSSLASSLKSLNSSNYPSPAPLFSPLPLSTSSSSPFTSSQYITGSTFSSTSSSTISPVLSSSIVSGASSLGFATSPRSPPPSSSSTSTPATSLFPLGSSYSSNSSATSSSSILKPNFKLNIGHELKPNLPNSETKPKRPSNPSGTPDKEEKYPDIIPRHSAWELGMLLGSSAGLGMVLVVGIRYMYRQACHKQTEMTLNDREREYGRGERGLIHVQECGDLVRVRRIRENSFVLLAEYDILSKKTD
uniref:Reelin domain-containing protein n=1 Tax=Monopterus albus TaxID=43700 RepID=A0A3Q3IYQ1_MONAL